MRWVLGTIAVLVGLLLVLLGAAWVWTGSEGSARWALEQVAKRQPLVAENVRGSLRRGVLADRLAWSQDGLAVEARDVDVAWQPLELLHRKVHLDHLRAASLRVDDKRPPKEGKSPPPTSLALPWPVAVDDIAIGRIDVAGSMPVDVRNLAGSYAYDRREHHVVLRNAHAYDGQYRGDVRVGGDGDMRLKADLQGRIAAPVPGAAQPVPVTFDAQANGPLAGFDVRLRIAGTAGSAAPAMRADATARVTPWADSPVAAARADLEGFDAGALWPQLPHMLLSGEVAAAPRAAGAWALNADLRNALVGPWDQHRIPASRVRVEGEWRGATRVLVRDLEAEVGGGRVVAQGAWEGQDAWKVDGRLDGVDPAAIHTAMAPVPIAGRVSLRGQGTAIAFDADLAARGGPVRKAGSELAAAVGALELRSLRAKGRWAGQELALPVLEVRTADAKLDAGVDLHLGSATGRGRVDLEAPGLRARGVGSVARAQGGGTVKLSLPDIRQAQRWLARLPMVPQAVTGAPALAGRGELQLAWQGGWEDPTVQAMASIPTLQPAEATPETWSVKDLGAKLDGRLADARLDAKAQGQWGARQATVDLVARAGRRNAGTFQGELSSLAAVLRDPAVGTGPWRVDVRKAVDWRWSAGQLETGAGEAVLQAPSTPPTQAQVAWEPVRWRPGQLRSAGRVTGLPLAWAELLGGPQLAGTALAGDLVFDGQWDAQLGEVLRLRAQLARRSGDVSVRAEATDGTSTRVQAGVREARLALDSEGDAVTLTLRWDSERAGTADARLQTRLSRTNEGWAWPEAAPLSGAVRAQLPRLGVWSLLAPPGWRLRGSLAADVAVAGTRGDPQLSGTLHADDLALRSVVDGISLQDGMLRARLEGRRLLVEQVRLQGPGTDGGVVTGSGEGGWSRDGVQARVVLDLDHLHVSSRSDRDLTVSGQLTASMDAAGAQVRGALHVDRARIELPDEAAPKLGDDVVVRNLPQGVTLGKVKPQGDAPKGRPVQLAVTLDFGRDFRVRGRGIETRLAGTLNIAGDSLAEPRLVGSIRTIGGEYRAYGQDLGIERGVLRFTGPMDNPALDVLALRPRLAGGQKAGVQITGSAQAPFVRLYSEPQLSEAETLSWLVLGRASASGGAETALLQQAAVALLASRAHRGDGKGVAGIVGLDELSVSRAGAEGPAVTLGKRLGRNLYAAYERSLSGAVGTLSVYYDLSRRVTVRASAGERAAVDLIVTFSYD
nr:translocation/assembly module TamB domain-containing protein [Ramlibacter algicola]